MSVAAGYDGAYHNDKYFEKYLSEFRRKYGFEGLFLKEEKYLFFMIEIYRTDPKILILDEATSNVDTRTEKAIQDAMHLVMQKGKYYDLYMTQYAGIAI